ncbi:MAG: acyloxyacyl hydrolase [Pseudomonadota bacterium]
MNPRQLLLGLAATALSIAAVFPCAAADLRPGQVFVQGGVGDKHTDSLTVGARWPWAWRTEFIGMEATAATEAFVSLWRAPEFGGGHQTYAQLGLVPMFRLRFDQGRSPWFAEGGIGITVTNAVYNTPERQFSTAGNFIDTLAVGRNFGADNAHELSLRIAHFSNASIKKPNPGLNFIQLRYGMKF